MFASRPAQISTGKIMRNAQDILAICTPVKSMGDAFETDSGL